MQCQAYIQEAELIKRSFTVFKEEQSERKYWATSQIYSIVDDVIIHMTCNKVCFIENAWFWKNLRYMLFVLHFWLPVVCEIYVQSYFEKVWCFEKWSNEKESEWKELNGIFKLKCLESNRRSVNEMEEFVLSRIKEMVWIEWNFWNKIIVWLNQIVRF